MPEHVEESVVLVTPAGRRRVKLLRYLGEVWVPLDAANAEVEELPEKLVAEADEDGGDHAEE